MGVIEALSTYYLAIAILGLSFMVISIFLPVFDMLEDLFNPLEWLSTISMFGAVGYVLTKYTGFSSLYVFLLSMGTSILTYILMHFFIVKPMDNAENSITKSIRDLIGKVGEVYTTIPPTGYGEIIIKGKLGTSHLTAKSIDGIEIKAGEEVVIIDIEDSVALVSNFDED